MPPKDPEARREYQREYQRKNRERIRENQRRWEERNIERVKEYRREHYKKNRERILQRQKEREAQDPEAHRKRKREAVAKWRVDNPERARENQRRGHVKRKYGLTLEEYEAILARGCAICGAEDDLQWSNKRRLCLDHNHANGKVRAALCHHCNVGLGSFQDDPKLMRKAARYIEKHRKT